MSYVEKTLGKGEKVLYRARFNWTYDVGAWFWLIVSATPYLLIAGLGASDPAEMMDEGTMALAAFAGLPLLFGVGIWLAAMMRKWTTEIAVTNSRFVMKTGLISRRTGEVNLAKIEEVNLVQSFWGRVFNYGRLTIRGTGVGVLNLPPLDNPLQLRRKLQDGKAAVLHHS